MTINSLRRSILVSNHETIWIEYYWQINNISSFCFQKKVVNPSRFFSLSSHFGDPWRKMKIGIQVLRERSIWLDWSKRHLIPIKCCLFFDKDRSNRFGDIEKKLHKNCSFQENKSFNSIDSNNILHLLKEKKIGYIFAKAGSLVASWRKKKKKIDIVGLKCLL